MEPVCVYKQPQCGAHLQLCDIYGVPGPETQYNRGSKGKDIRATHQMTSPAKDSGHTKVKSKSSSSSLEKEGTGRDEKTTAIVAAARRTFLAKGFDAASMDEIALSASVSKRTVYNRFRSKEDLFAAAILETCNSVLPLNLEEIESSLQMMDLLRALSSKFLHAILEPEALALRRIAGFEASRKPALGKAYLENGPRFMVKVCIPVLQRLAERNQINIPNTEKALWQLGSLVTEPLYTYVLMGDPPDQLEEAIQAQLDRGLDAFCKLYNIG